MTQFGFSTHDHVGHMVYDSAGAECLSCHQRWVLVVIEPTEAEREARPFAQSTKFLDPQPYYGPHEHRIAIPQRLASAKKPVRPRSR